MGFITELNYQFDVDKILEVTDQCSHLTQVTLNNRGDDLSMEEQLICGSGGLQNWYEIKTYEDIKDKDFHWYKLNDFFVNTYIEELYNKIQKDWQVGRSRVMTLGPNVCYSYHYDFSKRIHIPLVTNENCKFFDKDWNVYHLEVGKTYVVDTTQFHTTGNFGKENRTHVVMAIK